MALPPASAVPLADVDSLLEPIRKQYHLPALAAAVIVQGHVAAVGAVGVRKYGTNVPVTVGDQFHLGSCTKAMTATLCGMLVEQGRLHWNTTLAQVFPHISMQPAYRSVTLDHLLAQRSGFSAESWPQGKTFQEMFALPGSPRQQRMAYLEMILREPPVAEPGAEFVYSNRNYAAAGVILEQTAHIAWEDMITRKLFAPLDMTSAGFGAMGTPGKLDEPWQHRFINGQHLAIGPGPFSDNPPVIAPAAAVHCSLGDWAKFVRLHLSASTKTHLLLKPQTLQRLHTPQFGGDYAGGWLVTSRPWGGGTVLTHAGSNTQNYAVAWLAPLRDFAVLVVTNQGGDPAAQAADQTSAALIQHFISPSGYN